MKEAKAAQEAQVECRTLWGDMEKKPRSPSMQKANGVEIVTFSTEDKKKMADRREEGGLREARLKALHSSSSSAYPGLSSKPARLMH